MTAITPPKIFSKEVAQKQATPFPRRDLLTARNRFWPNFRGWRLDEFSIFARPPPGGGAHVRADDLEAFPSGLGRAASGATYLPTRWRFAQAASHSSCVLNPQYCGSCSDTISTSNSPQIACRMRYCEGQSGTRVCRCLQRPVRSWNVRFASNT